MMKQTELNLEAIGMKGLVRPLSNLELREIDGGNRENGKSMGWFHTLVDFLVGGTGAGSGGGAASIV